MIEIKQVILQIILILFAHFIADFVIQERKIAETKHNSFKS